MNTKIHTAVLPIRKALTISIVNTGITIHNFLLSVIALVVVNSSR